MYGTDGVSGNLGVPARAPEHGAVKERSFGIALLLYIVTLGFYRYWFHYLTHDEFCREIGRENREKTVFWSWVAVDVAMVVLALIALVLMFAPAIAAIEGGNEEAVAEAAITALIGAIGLVITIVILGTVSLVLIIVFVAKQYETLQTFRNRNGLPHKHGAGWFFGFYYGSAAASMFLGFLILPAFAPLICQPMAYYNLVEHYSEVRRFRDGRLPMPGSYGSSQGGYPGSPGAPSLQAAPPTTAALSASPSAAVPTKPDAWGRPSDDTFSVRRRDPGYTGSSSPSPPAVAANGGRTVEQTFRCPRCHAHVTAKGAPGQLVTVACASCGNAGSVPMPGA